MVSDQDPVVVPKLAAVPLAIPVVVQTRTQVGCGLDLPLPVDEGQESLDDDGLDVIFPDESPPWRYQMSVMTYVLSRMQLRPCLTGRLWCH